MAGKLVPIVLKEQRLKHCVPLKCQEPITHQYSVAFQQYGTPRPVAVSRHSLKLQIIKIASLYNDSCEYVE
jgi:hypothetical protein